MAKQKPKFKLWAYSVIYEDLWDGAMHNVLGLCNANTEEEVHSKATIIVDPTGINQLLNIQMITILEIQLKDLSPKP